MSESNVRLMVMSNVEQTLYFGWKLKSGWQKPTSVGFWHKVQILKKYT